ncbi:hypothetical protein Dda_8402 [Drechslerella dactyloides]|uniref:Uncharacterized protein n=1 Tax=Drechslerella dactyloides TaxID=74499 RepID=A0AAD6NFN3_DREDA|nr:hypothetical protein Dda_8402 [Drechslerella dactyloides]
MFMCHRDLAAVQLGPPGAMCPTCCQPRLHLHCDQEIWLNFLASDPSTTTRNHGKTSNRSPDEPNLNVSAQSRNCSSSLFQFPPLDGIVHAYRDSPFPTPSEV